MVKKIFENTNKTKLTINKKLDKSLSATLNGDWLRISQIITNLVSNAIKFSPKDNEIKFTAKYVDSKLLIIVSDNGIGMNQEVQDKIDSLGIDYSQGYFHGAPSKSIDI